VAGGSSRGHEAFNIKMMACAFCVSCRLLEMARSYPVQVPPAGARCMVGGSPSGVLTNSNI
jgi:hypothetical protein